MSKKLSREGDILGNIILNREVWEELTKKYPWCKFQRGLWENYGVPRRALKTEITMSERELRWGHAYSVCRTQLQAICGG